MYNIPPHHLSWWTPETFIKGVAHLGFNVIEIGEEPLAKIHWRDYLPAILEELPGGEVIAKVVVRFRILGIFIRFMEVLGIRDLPIKGHTLYVVLQLASAGGV
jgi:hypothetical protein